ncbi:MAG TPA: hypothetical protein VFQ39_07935, partial [Longimicrobium sp.]|nr:hypothetical protein [Longimicrobium sp.]
RGITRSERAVFTPAVFARADAGANVVTAGVWSAWEFREAPQATLSLRPPRSAGVGEIDLWAQYTRHVLQTDLSAGVVRYLFPEREGEDATEAYLQLWPDSTGLPVDLRGALHVGLEEESPVYAEVEASHSFSLAPLPGGPPSLLLGATGGFSLHAPANARPAAFDDEGPTHLLLAATLLVPADRLTVHAGVRHQRSFDGATRRVAPGETSDHRTWGELGLAYVVGPQRKAK